MKKVYTAAFKAPFSLELLKEEKTLAQISAEYGVHANVLHKWRTQALKGIASLFERRDDVAALKTSHSQQVEELYAEIGRLMAQVNWLKKKLPPSLMGQDERSLSQRQKTCRFAPKRLCSPSVERISSISRYHHQHAKWQSNIVLTSCIRPARSMGRAECKCCWNHSLDHLPAIRCVAPCTRWTVRRFMGVPTLASSIQTIVSIPICCGISQRRTQITSGEWIVRMCEFVVVGYTLLPFSIGSRAMSSAGSWMTLYSGNRFCA